MHIAAQAKMP